MLLQRIETEVGRLSSSFSTGQAIKDGIPICIAGAPNAGKSTLLNALLQEEKALVPGAWNHQRQYRGCAADRWSEISIDRYRGIRSTDDQIEQMGIDRTYQKIDQAAMVLFLIDLGATEDAHLHSLKELKEIAPDKIVRVVLNKADAYPEQQARKKFDKWECLSISAKMQDGLSEEVGHQQRLQCPLLCPCTQPLANARHHGELHAVKLFQPFERV